MGHTIADINNDGYMDAFITALTYSSKSCALYTCAVGAVGNALYENHGNRNFTNTAIEVYLFKKNVFTSTKSS